MQSSVTKVFVLSILLIILLLVRIMFFSYKQSNNVQNTVRFMQQSHDIRYQAQKLVSFMHGFERYHYNTINLDTATQKQALLIKLQIQQSFQQLSIWVKNDAKQVSNLKSLKNLINHRIFITEQKSTLPNTYLLATSNNFINKLNAVASQIEQEELTRIKTFQAGNDKTIVTINIIFYILGALVLFLIIAIVVNIQKQAYEYKANTLLQEYSALIDLSNDAIVTTDADSQILQWSKGAENLYGFTKDEVTGKKIGLFTNPIISDSEMENILALIDKTGSWRGEMIQHNKAGEALYLDVSYSRILNNDGTVKGFSSIRSNITELKKSEVRLQDVNNDLEIAIINKTKEIKEVFERMQKAFLAFDANWVCTYANHPISTYLGLPPEVIIGKNFNDFFKGITQTNFYAACIKALETQEMQELKEYVPYFNCWFESSIYPAANGVSIYLSDITDQKKIEQEIINQKRQLRNLTNHIQNLREEERKIIARELHDDLGQIATILKIDIKSLKNNLPVDNALLMGKVDYTLETVDELIKKIRKISHQLRPPLLDNVGLQAALKSYCQEYERKTGIVCTFASSLLDERLDQDVEIALFRICQEALTNVARHADASLVSVSLTNIEDIITLKVKDNGRGFDTSTLGNTLGIIGIKERAANINFNLEIETAKGAGTAIIASGLLKDLTPLQ
jgi:PAS domain S-box-containing protein